MFHTIRSGFSAGPATGYRVPVQSPRPLLFGHDDSSRKPQRKSTSRYVIAGFLGALSIIGLAGGVVTKRGPAIAVGGMMGSISLIQLSSAMRHRRLEELAEQAEKEAAERAAFEKATALPVPPPSMPAPLDLVGPVPGNPEKPHPDGKTS